MKRLIWVAWILLAWPAHAQVYSSDVECLRHHNNCRSAGPGQPWWPTGGPIYDPGDTCRPGCGINPDGNTALITQNNTGAVYSTPAPARNWNLLIQNTYSTSLTVHLYKEECEALLSQFTSVPPATQTCFQTPKP